MSKTLENAGNIRALFVKNKKGGRSPPVNLTITRGAFCAATGWSIFSLKMLC